MDSRWFKQECHESSLAKMNIGRQSFQDFFLRHQHERDAIGEAPFLVRPCPIQIECFVQKGLGNRDNLVCLLFLEFRQNLQPFDRRLSRA